MRNKTLISLLFFSASLWANVAKAEVLVIVNSANTNALDKSYISKLYKSKKKTFPDGTKAIPVGQVEGNPVTEEFAKKVIDKSLSQLKAYRAKLVFSGKGIPPKELASDSEVINFVVSNPDAIGFVSEADGSVKVVGVF